MYVDSLYCGWFAEPSAYSQLSSNRNACSGLVAVGTARVRRMKKYERVASEMFERDGDNVAGACQACMGVPNRALGLTSACPQPLVREVEALAAVVVLQVVDAGLTAVVENGDVLRHAIGNAREKLSQMKHRIGVVIDAKQENLSVQVMYAADRAFRDVRWKRQRAGRDLRSHRTARRNSEGVIASPHIRQPPERIGHDTEIGRSASGRGIERLVVVSGPGRHHQGAFGPDSVSERRDQAQRPSLDRSRGAEGRVHEQDIALPNSKRAELIRHFGCAQFAPALIHDGHLPGMNQIGIDVAS